MNGKDPALIKRVVCEYTNESIDDLKAKCRLKERVYARHLIFYFLRKYTDLKLWEIGFTFGLRHDTALHGIRRIKNEMCYPEVRKDIEIINQMILS